MLVMKFGGTSVADAPAIAHVLGDRGARESLVRRAAGRRGVSAMAGVTDALLALAASRSAASSRTPPLKHCGSVTRTPSAHSFRA
jgi:aspartokinase